MKVMRTIFITILSVLMVGCTSKPKHNPIVDTINNSIGINDTLGLSLHPEYPVYSTRQKQVTFVLHNNSGTDISFGGYYSYTYEDEKGTWREVPMQLVVFAEEIMLQQGNTYYYNADLFRHAPGRYRFFLTIRRYSRKYTLMAEFQLQNNAVGLLKRHSDNRQKDTLPPEEEIVGRPIYNVVDQMPEFPGGMDKLLQFINGNMQYPAEARKKGIQGRVTVQFIVDEDGHITEPNIVRSVDPFLDKEALRIIKTLPQWKPGTLKGKAVKVKYTVPVTFRLDKTKEIPQVPQSMAQTLHPVPRNIPIGKNMNPDSLSMKTEYACYPPPTTEVRIFVTNHSRQKYTCGNDYSLAFYNGSKRQWETISANPTIEDIGWVLLPQYPPHRQTIKLHASEISNRPGKYRIYKTFYNRDAKEVAYAEFEITSSE